MGSINFKTGSVTVDSAVQLGTKVPVIKERKSWGAIEDSLDESRVSGTSTTLQSLFSAQGKTWDPTDKTTEHTIKIFYLERGGCYSNLKMEFSLPTVVREGDVSFTKTDTDENVLPNAEFGLYTDAECTIPLEIEYDTPVTAASNSEGIVEFNNIPVGSNEDSHIYYMKEISAPFGYAISNKKYEVTIAYRDNTAGLTSSIKDISADEVVESISNRPIELDIQKLDENEFPILGSTFSIAKPDGTTETFSPSGSEAKATLTGFIDGSYTITETVPPPGYRSIDGAINFKIDKGVISTVGTLPSGVTWDGDSFTFQVRNAPNPEDGKIKVRKRWHRPIPLREPPSQLPNIRTAILM